MWFAFQGLEGGQAVNLSGSDEAEAIAAGFHGYATQAQAQANLDLSVHIEIQEDNYWRLLGKAAITLGGDPVTIYVNIDTLDGMTEEAIIKALIHELLHAKISAYENKGVPSPYPGGHDDPKFKARVAELEKLAGV